MKRVSIAIIILLILAFAASGCTQIKWFLGLEKRPTKEHKRKESTKDSISKATETKLAREIMSQQRESKDNLSRLADGQIKRITVDKVTTIPNEASLAIEAFYTDNSSLPGALAFWRRGGKWYLVEVTRQPRLPNPPTGTLVEDLTKEDIAIGRKIVREQIKHQETVTDLVTEQVKELDIDQVDAQTETATVYVTALYVTGDKLNITMDMSFVNGYWYIVSMYEK